jgi:thiamine-phosphate diphosphorylase
VTRVGAAATAGVQLVQVRERDLDGGALADLVSSCVAAVRGTATRILVNDRLDVALAAGAHGVHLRAASLSARRVRQLAAPGFLVGRSVHDPDEIAAANRERSVDYLLFGTVWPTSSKPGVRTTGAGALGAAVRSTPLPMLAVGGVTWARIGEIARSGAAGLAAIGLFCEDDTGDATDGRELPSTVHRIRQEWAAALAGR